jgi:hypothetical protein
MALSEEERKLLAQMEAALAAEDPRLASALRGGHGQRYRLRAVLAATGFVIGLAALVVGMELHPLVSVAGFAIMLVATVAVVSAWRPAEAESGAGAKRDSGKDDDFLERLDERWRRGDDDGR